MLTLAYHKQQSAPATAASLLQNGRAFGGGPMDFFPGCLNLFVLLPSSIRP